MKLHVSGLSTLEAVIIGKKFRVLDWLRTSYIKLVEQESLKINDLLNPSPPAHALDWETIARVFSVRESRARANPSQQSHHYCPGCSQYTAFDLCSCGHRSFSGALEEVFQDEFKTMKVDYDRPLNPPLPGVLLD